MLQERCEQLLLRLEKRRRGRRSCGAKRVRLSDTHRQQSTQCRPTSPPALDSDRNWRFADADADADASLVDGDEKQTRVRTTQTQSQKSRNRSQSGRMRSRTVPQPQDTRRRRSSSERMGTVETGGGGGAADALSSARRSRVRSVPVRAPRGGRGDRDKESSCSPSRGPRGQRTAHVSRGRVHSAEDLRAAAGEDTREAQILEQLETLAHSLQASAFLL